MYRGIVVAAALMLVILVAGACAPRTATPAVSVSGDRPVAGQLAEAGQGVYIKSCQGCHGTESEAGPAPALVGANAKLGARHSNAQELHDYIIKSMPRGAPGSLSAQEYLQVLSHLLVANDAIDADTALDAQALATISLAD